MNFKGITLLCILLSGVAFGQNTTPDHDFKSPRKSRLYFYWGWNRGAYSRSDLHFSGEGYNFTLKKAVAKDRQSPFEIKTYLNPVNVTIPQYNFRVGYYLNDRWDLSFGADHMKYVMQQDQEVHITGYIHDTHSGYDRDYTDNTIVLTEDFLQFEHTDGLNYLNVEIRHTDPLFSFNKIQIDLIEGLGAGALIPRTNTTLLNKERYDQFHLSGYGVDMIVAGRISFFNAFFIQTEAKGGFINLPDIRTTQFESDRARQSFFFSQVNIVFGGIINLSRK